MHEIFLGCFDPSSVAALPRTCTIKKREYLFAAINGRSSTGNPRKLRLKLKSPRGEKCANLKLEMKRAAAQPGQMLTGCKLHNWLLCLDLCGKLA